MQRHRNPATVPGTVTRASRSRERVLGLPPVHSRFVPGYVLVADRNNNRVLIVSPAKKVVWAATNLRGPDDAFFTPGYRSIITNEEFNDTLTELSLRTKRRIWHYGHAGVAGSSPGYLNTPDDAYRLPNGETTVADIQNCRVVYLRHSGAVARVLGGSCVHDPPRGFSSPNGATPLPGGGLLVTEIGGWIDRMSASGALIWSMRSPVAYPSDAQLLPDGRVLVASFSSPGRIVIVDRFGHVDWSFGTSSGPNYLDKPSLAVRWPNGMIAANDDYNHRIIVIDPRTKRIVWQYGHTGVAGTAPGFLNKPDGLDLLPGAGTAAPAQAPVRKAAPPVQTKPSPRLQVRRVGSLPESASRVAAVALPDGRILALGGLVAGSSSDQILRGPPANLRAAGRLPTPTHDAAAALVGRSAYLFGGGEAVSSPAVVRINPATGAATPAGTLGEPLSDLGAATVGGQDVPRRRLYRHALRNGRPPLPSRPGACPGHAPPCRPALRGCGRARRQDLRRGRADDRGRHEPGPRRRPGPTDSYARREAARAPGARRPRPARLAPAARRRRLVADPLDRPAGSHRARPPADCRPPSRTRPRSP